MDKKRESLWHDNWLAARKRKDARRAENVAKWAQRRDWSDDNQHKTEAVIEVDSDGGSRSLAALRAIMADTATPLHRRLDAAEVILTFELGPGAAVGADPDQIAAASYQFLNAVAASPQTPEALRFRALKSIAAVENARAAQKSSTVTNSAKRDVLAHLYNSTRARPLREAGSWREMAKAGDGWATKLGEGSWPAGWPGHWTWPPTSFAEALEGGDAETFRAELRALAT